MKMNCNSQNSCKKSTPLLRGLHPMTYFIVKASYALSHHYPPKDLEMRMLKRMMMKKAKIKKTKHTRSRVTLLVIDS
jgi:hypothetical protein